MQGQQEGKGLCTNLQGPALGGVFWPWYGYLQKSYLLSSTGTRLFPGLQTIFTPESFKNDIFNTMQ